MTTRPLGLDLFCGVGGMSLGFEQAGFEIAGAFDKEHFNIETHAKNFPDTNAHQVDLATETAQSLRNLAKIGKRKIDVVFGGPPCQGFSAGGRQDVNDERNLLVYEYARLVRELKPNYFVFENVRGLMYERSKPVLASLVRRFKLAGYQLVEPIKILNAADYGVPQRRERVFIIGCKKGLSLPAYPEREGCFDEFGNETFPTVKDAIRDLPSIENKPKLFDCDSVKATYKKTQSSFALQMRGELICCDNRSSREFPELEALTGFLRTRHASDVIERFSNTAPGSAEEVSRYIRLSWQSVAPTLRAGTGRDHGSHTAPRPIHPSNPRCITTREAARLHSFPDWFQFYGTRWHDFRQIGNSVPPLLAKAVAASVRDVID